MAGNLSVFLWRGRDVRGEILRTEIFFFLVRAKIGHYPELAKLTQQAIPHARLIEFAELGHAPQMQDPQAFHKALLDGLAAVPADH